LGGVFRLVTLPRWPGNIAIDREKPYTRLEFRIAAQDSSMILPEAPDDADERVAEELRAAGSSRLSWRFASAKV